MRENDQSLSFNSNLSIKFWVEKGVNNSEVAVDIIAENLLFNFTLLIIDGNKL